MLYQSFDFTGLTLLLPYILHKSKQWKHAKLRVFCQGTKKGDMTEDRAKFVFYVELFPFTY
jgi:hypothetical protein